MTSAASCLCPRGFATSQLSTLTYVVSTLLLLLCIGCCACWVHTEGGESWWHQVGTLLVAGSRNSVHLQTQCTHFAGEKPTCCHLDSDLHRPERPSVCQLCFTNCEHGIKAHLPANWACPLVPPASCLQTLKTTSGLPTYLILCLSVPRTCPGARSGHPRAEAQVFQGTGNSTWHHLSPHTQRQQGC